MRNGSNYANYARTLLLYITLVCCVGQLEAKQTYGNLCVQKVVRVYDGDTIIVDIDGVHPIIGKEISVRINGIDTPEIRDARPEVKELAYKARDYLTVRLQNTSVIELQNIQRDKYFRILADVFLDGVNIATEMIECGLAYPYDGRTKTEW